MDLPKTYPCSRDEVMQLTSFHSTGIEIKVGGRAGCSRALLLSASTANMNPTTVFDIYYGLVEMRSYQLTANVSFLLPLNTCLLLRNQLDCFQ